MKFRFEDLYTVEVNAYNSTGDKTKEFLIALCVYLYELRDYHNDSGRLATAEMIDKTIRNLNDTIDIMVAKDNSF